MPPWHLDRCVEEVRGDDDGQVGTAVEANVDLGLGDGDVGWGVDEVAEDVASLGVGVTAHAPGQQTVEAAGDDQERHVEVDFESDR